MHAANEKIGRFIGNSGTVFIIPPFQRNYSWGEEQCEELFDDIKNSMKRKKSHYIGNIVYYIGENNRASFNEYILIDGQQRITSILLLLCAIRSKLPADEVKRLEKRYLINEDEEDEKYRVKLKQTDSDLRVFEKIINHEPMTLDEKENRLFKNYNYFLDKLIDFNEESAEEFYNTIADLDIVDLNLQIENDLEAVQKIFEKINSTGKPLTIADLIRNYLLISSNTDEQKRLYDNYWVKIENMYNDKDDISDFAKHYLITKRGIWAEEKKMYNTFKLYFDNNNLKKEDVLAEILMYSKYYNWFIDENCPNEKINIILKELNVLKSDDMYSLLLVLFEKLYENEKENLRQILDLLTDYMIRWRIVSPVNGSGDIRKTIYNVLSKITKDGEDITYDNVLYWLSNSPSPGGRFPDDAEFKNALKGYINTLYAKALLYKLEYKEVKNIEVDIRKVTVEHLMPQKLSSEWKEYLGGETNAALIYNNYINNIGNLALLSRPLNSENSNAKWDNKKKNINDAQFILTNSIDKECKWDDKAIVNRAEEITEMALKHIKGPIERDREFESVEISENYDAGIYNAKDVVFDVTGRTVKAVIYNNVPYSVKGWSQLIPVVSKIMIENDPEKFDEIVRYNKVHKSTNKTSYYLGNDPIISQDSKYFVTPYKIEDTQYYYESCLNAERTKVYVLTLIKEFGLMDSFKIEIE